MELLLPETLNIDSLSSVVSAWPSVEEDVVLNFSAQRWVYPSGTVGLSCLIEGAISRGQTVQGIAGECRNITYWERMGFFDNFHVPGIPSSGARREAGDRFSEIRLIYEIDEVDSLADELVTVTSPDESARRIYLHVVTEALNNVCQHSGSIGFCASQYYRDQNVRICIGDSGVGLKSSLARFDLGNDRQAIEKALQVGISGRSRAEQLMEPEHMRNRGVGLTAIHRLVVANEGSLAIWSGDAMLRGTNRTTRVLSRPSWQGTLLAAKMPRNRIERTFQDVMRELTSELKVTEKARGRRLRRHG